MEKVTMQVRGVQRNVYIEKNLGGGKYAARTYVGPRSRTTVSGTVRKYINGALRFTPEGVNAHLV